MQIMKMKTATMGSLFLAFFAFSSYTLNYDDGGRNEMLIRLLIQGLETNHYQPQNLDDTFSSNVFELYLKRIDYNKRFFLQSDLESLQKHRTQVDDEIKESRYDFFTDANTLFDLRLEQARLICERILAKPFDFTVAETLEADYKNMPFAANEAELEERWRKFLKYQVLTRIEGKEEGFGPQSETFAEKEAAARAKVAKIYVDYFRRTSKMDLNERRSSYLNTIVNVYDPHTGYFPPADKANFDISMSGKLEGIGAQLQEADGFIKVSSIVPGSASARQGELKVGDVILKVAQGTDEPVDVVDMPLDDAVQLIRGKKGTEVRLTVKKIDGKETIIPIIRDVVELEDTYAASAILTDEKGKKQYGYIHLPKFYADFNDRNGRRCAADVAKEVEKLKAAGVRGIVIDLRDNGGGSLQDVVEMTGLFIDKGPIVQVRSRQGRNQVLYDPDPRVQYDGPLVIMVNNFSASASEIMAAAIQDYGRGVIIGTPTFGKGTVQRFLDLDEYIKDDPEIMPLGDVKLTTQKFYRITGASTQLKGVTPDIVLPDEYALLEMGEREQEYYMPWDEIEAAKFLPYPVKPNTASLAAKSQARIDANPTFSLIEENAQRLKRQQDKSVYPMSWTGYMEEKKALEAESEKFKDVEKEIPGFEVMLAPADVTAISGDTIKQRKLNDWKGRIAKDPYVFEAMKVLQDWN